MDRELKILIVEDVPRDAEAMEEALRSEGLRFESRRLETKEEYLRTLRDFQPDIVLSDFTLPEFDALEALRLLKIHQYDIPLILVTGSRSEEVAVECIKEGADDYILKASLKRLPSSVINVLEKKAADRKRRQAEAALGQSEKHFRLIAENSHDLISLLDPQGCFLYASSSFRQALGYVPEELIGTPMSQMVHPDDGKKLSQIMYESLTTRAGSSGEYRLQHLDQHYSIFESTGNWVFDEQDQPQRLVLVSRDVTQRKQSEDILRALPQLIREAQEAERRRVARELHDSVNQMLASVKFRVEALEEKLLDHDLAAWRESLKAKTLLERAMNEVRRISHNLRPSELDDLGLIPAVRSLCKEFGERTGLQMNLDLRHLPDNASKEFELNVYRIIQEALSNIEKHSEATEVILSTAREKGLVHIRIQDNGCGFDPSTLNQDQNDVASMGLMDMKERAAFIGSTWSLASRPGNGVEITLRLPEKPATLPQKNVRKERKRKTH